MFMYIKEKWGFTRLNFIFLKKWHGHYVSNIVGFINKTKSLLDAIIKSVFQCSCLACLQSLIAKPYCIGKPDCVQCVKFTSFTI